MLRVPETKFLHGTITSGRAVQAIFCRSRHQHRPYRVPWSRCIFWTTPAATFGDLFICAKNLLVEAIADQCGGLGVVSLDALTYT